MPDGEEGYYGTIYRRYGILFDQTNPDTDGDGILDGDEVFGQSKSQTVETHDDVISYISVSMNVSGNLDRTLSIESVYGIDLMSTDVVGLLGDPFAFETDSTCDCATITFTVNPANLGATAFSDLIVLWYDEENQKYVECTTENGFGTTLNATVSTVSVQTTHFSKFMLVDSKAWYDAWETSFSRIYNAAPPTAGGSTYVSIDHYNTVFVIDTSGSMQDNPEDQRPGYDPIVRVLRDDAPARPPIVDAAMEAYWLSHYGINTCKRITACENVIDKMCTDDQAAIITFSYGNSTDTKTLSGLTSNQTALKNSLQNFTDEGGTCFSYALNQAVELLQNSGELGQDNIKNRVLFFSDGEPDQDTSTAINAAVASAAANEIEIYTFGLGLAAGDAVLESMAQSTGGDFYEVMEASELPRVVEEAAKKKTDLSHDFVSLMNVNSDGDSLPDIVEQYGLKYNGTPFQTDIDKEDTDGDGLWDDEEVLFDKTTLIAGLKKGVCTEGITLYANPTLEDSDGDDLCDEEEDYLDTYPLTADTDQDRLTDGLEVDLWFDPLDSNPDGDSYSDYEEWIKNTSPFVYNLTVEEAAKAFAKGAALGDWVTAENIEILLGQIAFSFVPLIADARDYFANLFVNQDTVSALFNVGGFVLDFIPGVGVAGDAAKALPKLARFVAKYADDAPKVVEAIIRSSKLFPNADDVVPELLKILPVGALDDIAASVKNGDKITKTDYAKLCDVLEATGKNADEITEGINNLVKRVDDVDDFRMTTHINVSKHAWNKVINGTVTNDAVQGVINQAIQKGAYKYLNQGQKVVEISFDYLGEVVIVRGRIVDGVLSVSDAWVKTVF